MLLHNHNTLFLTSLSLSLTSFSIGATADMGLFNVFHDPFTANKSFHGNIQGCYNNQDGGDTTSNYNITANTHLTWFQKSNALNLIGEISNSYSSYQQRSAKYQAIVRLSHNLNSEDFLFAQSNWLNNSGTSEERLAAGYGRHIFNGPIHTLRIEGGPGIYHTKDPGGENDTGVMTYSALSYSYQLTNHTKFVHGLLLLGNQDTTIHSETGLNIDINDHFSLKLSYNAVWKENYFQPEKQTLNTKALVSVIYRIP